MNRIKLGVRKQDDDILNAYLPVQYLAEKFPGEFKIKLFQFYLMHLKKNILFIIIYWYPFKTYFTLFLAILAYFVRKSETLHTQKKRYFIKICLRQT